MYFRLSSSMKLVLFGYRVDGTESGLMRIEGEEGVVELAAAAGGRVGGAGERGEVMVM